MGITTFDETYRPQTAVVMHPTALERLAALLHGREKPAIVAQAAAALRNVAYDTCHAAAILAAGAVPSVLLQLRSSAPGVAEPCVGLLSNLAHDSDAAVALLSAGAAPLLAALLKSALDSTTAANGGFGGSGSGRRALDGGVGSSRSFENGFGFKSGDSGASGGGYEVLEGAARCVYNLAAVSGWCRLQLAKVSNGACFMRCRPLRLLSVLSLAAWICAHAAGDSHTDETTISLVRREVVSGDIEAMLKQFVAFP